MRSSAFAVFGLAVAVAGALVAASSASAVRAETVRATRVTTYVPAVSGGAMRAGSCWTRSIAAPSRTDAWRCMLGNEIHDPCFAPPRRTGVVVCDADPVAGGRGFALRLTKPLPANEPVDDFGPLRPWLIQLADGEVCVPLTGTHELLGRETIGYECSRSREARAQGAETGLIDGSITGGTVWHARRAIFRIGHSGAVAVSVTRVPIAAVWR